VGETGGQRARCEGRLHGGTILGAEGDRRLRYCPLGCLGRGGLSCAFSGIGCRAAGIGPRAGYTTMLGSRDERRGAPFERQCAGPRSALPLDTRVSAV
jgi:hypothetical protein